MTHDKYSKMLISLVIPAIQAKLLVGEWFNPEFTIKIQQDGAGAHCSERDPELLAAVDDMVEAGNFPEGNVSFYTQLSNSPDLNILDLGLLNALQSAQYDLLTN